MCVYGKKKKCLVLCNNQTNETIISNGEIDAEDDSRCTVFGNVPPITTNCRRLHAKPEKIKGRKRGVMGKKKVEIFSSHGM